jgi:pimeloyl-ACP methyl ester carboxylesterase
MTESTWSDHEYELDGITLHAIEQGEGPGVLFVHGYPETSFSWRHQLPALAGAGYRAVAIDVRGYGRSSRPEDVEDYAMTRHVADNVRLAEALGLDEVVIVGHDWGAPIAATSALLRPDLFSAVGLLSVPYAPPSVRRPTEVFTELFGGADEFYINYFQEPGRADSEAAEDVLWWLSGFYYGASADAPPEATRFAVVPKGERMKDRLVQPGAEMSWLPDADLAHYVAEFERTGFTGGLNRYRNLDRDWADLAAFRGRPVVVPALFIGGDKDGPTIWGAAAIGRFPETLPRLFGSHILEHCGHWVQQEKPDEVNRLLLEFLAEVRPVS